MEIVKQKRTYIIEEKAFKAAFPYTLPICVGFLFLGTSYGFMMRSKGFSFVYPLCMSFFIYAGSMEFVTANLLLSAFDPVYAFFLTLMVNARHLFYGLSMLEKYKNTGWKKFYLIFGMCDESFTVNCTVDPPEGKEPPAVITYLGKVLPCAVIGLLVVFCLKDVPESTHYGLPELIAILFIVALHKWKKSTLLSIGGGTVFYMVLVQNIFS